MAGRGSRLEVRQSRTAWGSLVGGMVDEAWEVYKRMATLEYGALLVGAFQLPRVIIRIESL